MRQWPGNVDWQEWVGRFDRMQERYLIARRERFDTIVRVIRAVRPLPRRILDLGCGTGSLSEAVLQAFPECILTGIDLDDTLLVLAQRRLAPFGQRVVLLNEDLRQDRWIQSAGGQFDAVISATALHWLSADHLAELYGQLAQVMCPGGIFLNADHVASECTAVQNDRQDAKRRHLASQDHSTADNWKEFWQAYAAALGADGSTMGSNAVGNWEGVEDGMPLAWHFDRLRECGFAAVDCFWRCHSDAIYGGIRS